MVISPSIIIAIPFLLVGLLAASDAQEQPRPEQPIGILLAAGDIATCNPTGAKDEATAKLIGTEIEEAAKRDVPVRVIALGDLAYGRGTTAQFKCFHDSWGQYKEYILPVPGNHEYRDKPKSPGAPPERHAKPYFEYFRDNRFVVQNGPESGYYSLPFPDRYEGQWHLIGLNPYVHIGSGTPQLRSLKSDLAAAQARCILAFAHPFIFSSGKHGHGNVAEPKAPLRRGKWMANPYRILHEHRASIFLSAHEHAFEQFSRQDADGNKDDSGLRSFVVGTGGAGLYNEVIYDVREPNSEMYWQESRGILKIELFPDRYRWDFIPIHGDKDIALPVSEGHCNRRS